MSITHINRVASAHGYFRADAKTNKASDVAAINRPAVRIATMADEREVFRLLLLGHAENGIFPANNLKVAWYVRKFLQIQPPEYTGVRGVIGVIGDVPGGRLQAMCMVSVDRHWYTDQFHLGEWIIYLDPEFRKPSPGQPVGHGAALLDWLKEQTRITGLPVMSGVMSNTRSEAKCRMYGRQLKKIGEFFIHLPEGMKWAGDQIVYSSVQSSSSAA